MKPMSETKTYYIFQFIKDGDSPWECKRALDYNYVPHRSNGRLVTPIKSILPYSTHVSDTVAVKMNRFKTIVTVMVDKEDMELAESAWNEALDEFYKKRKRASDMAEKSRIRALDIESSTVDYTRP
jgi:hypothetical protein